MIKHIFGLLFVQMIITDMQKPGSKSSNKHSGKMSDFQSFKVTKVKATAMDTRGRNVITAAYNMVNTTVPNSEKFCRVRYENKFQFDGILSTIFIGIFK